MVVQVVVIDLVSQNFFIVMVIIYFRDINDYRFIFFQSLYVFRVLEYSVIGFVVIDSIYVMDLDMGVWG